MAESLSEEDDCPCGEYSPHEKIASNFFDKIHGILSGNRPHPKAEKPIYNRQKKEGTTPYIGFVDIDNFKSLY